MTDVSNAARTFLMDIHTLAWDADLLQRFGLSQDMLPRICSNAEVYGAVKGMPLDGVPIAGRASPSWMKMAVLFAERLIRMCRTGLKLHS